MRNFTPVRVFSAILGWVAVTTPALAQYGPHQTRQSYRDRSPAGQYPFGRTPGLPGMGLSGYDPLAGYRNIPGLPPELQLLMAGTDPFFPDHAWPYGRVNRPTHPQWPAGITPGRTAFSRRDDDSSPPLPAYGPVTMPNVPVSVPRVHFDPPKPIRVVPTPRVTGGGAGWLIGGVVAVIAAVVGMLKWLFGSKERPASIVAAPRPSARPSPPVMVGVGADGRAGVLLRSGPPDLPRP